MTAAPAVATSWENLVEVWQDLDVPEGWRAEIIEEHVAMSPPPGNVHNLIASRLHKRLARVVPDEWEIFQTAGVSVPTRASIFVPDLLVIPRSQVPVPDAPAALSVEHALLVVEITSKSNANTDRTTKLWSYARAGVPLYLLVDRFSKNGPETVLYSEPENGVYQDTHRAVFGKPVTLPEPFDLTLETTEF